MNSGTTKRTWMWAAISTCAVLAVCLPTLGEILNGDFEDGLAQWSSHGDANAPMVPGGGHVLRLGETECGGLSRVWQEELGDGPWRAQWVLCIELWPTPWATRARATAVSRRGI